MDTARCICADKPHLGVKYDEQFLGATWFRRGLQSSAGHAEVLDPRKTARNKLNANDERFALAA
jgi:hypothetical protein